MRDRATIERLVLAEVALADGWTSAKDIRKRLGLTYYEVMTALRDLVRVNDLDWNGLHDIDSGLYRLPRRAVGLSFKQRIAVAS